MAFMFFALVLTSGCALHRAVQPREKTQEGERYENKQFGFSFAIPEGWKRISNETLKQFAIQASTEVFGQSQELKEAIESSLPAIEKGFGIEYAPEQLSDPDVALFLFVSDNLNGIESIQTAADYLRHTKKLLQTSTKIPFKFDEKLHSQLLGGEKFDVMGVTMHTPDGIIYENYYVRIIDHHALVFITIYGENSELYRAETVLHSILFK